MDTATPTENDTASVVPGQSTKANKAETSTTNKVKAKTQATTKQKVDSQKPEEAKIAVNGEAVNSSKVEQPKIKPPTNQKQRPQGQQRRQRPPAKPAFDIKTATSAKSISYRTIKLRNKPLENNIKFCERIASSIMTITGSLVRCKEFDIQKEFDAYIEVLLTSHLNEVNATLRDFESKVDAYKTDGYEFVDTGAPGDMRVEIRSNHIACLLDLILNIDKLMTVASHLEKTPSLTSPELYELYSDWITIPRLINGRLMSLITVLDKKYRLNVKVKNEAKAKENVNFADVLAFMTGLKEEQKNGQATKSSSRSSDKQPKKPVVNETPVVASAPGPEQVADTLPTQTKSSADVPTEKEPSSVKDSNAFLDWTSK